MVQAENNGLPPACDESCSYEQSRSENCEDASPGCPEDTNCPVEGDHCHHAGVCGMHGVSFFFPAEKSTLPVAPEARDLAFEILDDRPEDGPVMKLDKPPLI
jgi:hypothetical protein